MNDTEKRRRQLLEETRRRYGDTRVPPAIHPRYGSIYSELYRSGEERAGISGTFGIRFIIAVMMFAAFIAMDNQKMKIASVDSKRIVTEIEKLSIEDWNKFLEGGIDRWSQILAKNKY